ncbi:MAG: HAMP domain-containing histidine kinase [Holophaga sp.]|nr:HAMP domain-containing histidine kinase [Holophaga sp.]
MPQHVVIGGKGYQDAAILHSALEHLLVPIRREETVIGVLLLESRESGRYTEDKLEFLSRLMDHASIAIANARLYAEVQEANKAKSDFVSFVAHELKNPMTSIRGFSDLLAQGVVGPVNENQANFLATIRSNVERMATLVTDLADVSRIEAGRLSLDFAAVEIGLVVDEVIRSLSRQIEDKKQVLDLQLPAGLPSVWGDKIRLIQVVTNLISNAYKYSPPEGRITVRAEAADNIWGEGSPRVIHLAVSDTGYGISPENQKKIFEKFYRSDDQKVRDAPGTGLGLNITKQLIELQGGKIWFESEFRVGTTFHIIVPIVETA